jgi:hypothetical protein
MNREIQSHDWRRYLHALPDAEAPDALWARIAQARAATVAPRPRGGRWMVGAALAASVALATVFAMRTPVEAPSAPAVATLAAPVADNEALRALDDTIALAYARNAAEEELASLWQTRERLLGSSADSEPLLARL